MITEANGNLLKADVEAIVNTVNTVGIMGKGIALQFKNAYPAMYEDYRRAALGGEVKLGLMHVWPTDRLTNPRFIINFPTKGHWKARSRLADIRSGLVDLVRVVEALEIRSIAVPPLGCGNGGLNWLDVEPLIRAAFSKLPDVDVFVFPPAGAPTAASMPIATTRPKMTPGRAALVEVLDKYTERALMDPGLIESQKLMYFLQEAGEPLRLQFAANRYGPYADNLRHVLTAVEGHFLRGFGDGSASVEYAEPLSVVPEAVADAARVLQERPETRQRIERVLDLSDGFESAYGLELLATVHWLATRGHLTKPDDVVAAVSSWSPRKARMFTTAHVTTALQTLRDRGWLPETLNA